MDELVTGSPENGVDKLWSKEQPKLQARINAWFDCAKQKSDLTRLSYVQNYSFNEFIILMGYDMFEGNSAKIEISQCT